MFNKIDEQMNFAAQKENAAIIEELQAQVSVKNELIMAQQNRILYLESCLADTIKIYSQQKKRIYQLEDLLGKSYKIAKKSGGTKKLKKKAQKAVSTSRPDIVKDILQDMKIAGIKQELKSHKVLDSKPEESTYYTRPRFERPPMKRYLFSHSSYED